MRWSNVFTRPNRRRVKAFFGQTVKEGAPDEVVPMSAHERDPKTAKESARIKNDYIFAQIGGEMPTKFQESIVLC